MKIFWIENNKFLLMVALITALLVYGVELGSFTLSIDEEVAAFDPSTWQGWLSQGRWGMSLLHWLLPNFTYIPYLATLIFSVSLALASVYFAKLFFSEVKEAAAFVILFVASPVWLHIAQFNTLSWGVGIGLLACALAVHLFQQHKISTTLLACLFAGFAAAIYQALLILYAMVLILLLMKRWYRLSKTDNHEFRFPVMAMQIAKACFGVFLALILYFLVQKIIMHFANVQLAYIGDYVHLNDYLENPAQTFASTRKKIQLLAIGTDTSYLGWGWAILLLPWLGSLASIWFAVSLYRKPFLLFIYGSTAILLLLLTFSLVIMAAGVIPLRAMISLPLLCAVLGAAGFRVLKNWPILRIAILGYSLLISIWMSAFLFGLDSLARQRDEAMATKIAMEISRAAPANLNVIPVVFVGEWMHQPVQGVSNVEIFGTSFFQQDGGNRYRMIMFMRLAGATNLETISLTAIKPYMSEVDKMPSWPIQGSVARIDNKVVVKLSALSYQQKLELGQ